MKRYAGPLFLLTGSNDRVTPPHFLQPLLAASASAVKRSLIVEGADHGDALAVAAARQAYAAFLDLVRSRPSR